MPISVFFKNVKLHVFKSQEQNQFFKNWFAKNFPVISLLFINFFLIKKYKTNFEKWLPEWNKYIQFPTRNHFNDNNPNRPSTRIMSTDTKKKNILCFP